MSQTNEEKLLVKLVPTKGGYQPVLTAKLVGEGKTFWRVRPDGIHSDWKFSKKDGLRTGSMKYKFPAYRIDLFVNEQNNSKR